jgi:predicted ATPase
MSIKSLHIKNFKSIVDIQIEDISNFSVFAGANGCGKSNFFEALEFVRDVIKNGAIDAIKKHNGYENIHSHKLRDKNAKRFYAKFEILIASNSYNYELEIRDLNKEPILIETVLKNKTEIAKKTSHQNLFVNGTKVEIEYSNNETILKLISKEAKELLNYLSSIERYQIDPNKAREADEYFASDVLDTNASNLTTVLSKLEKDNVSTEEIIETMGMIVPGLEKIKIEKEHLSNKTIVTFKEEAISRKFPAGLVSDGTIYALAMLVIIYSNKNGIILIEEPERGLNPKAIAELVEFFRERSQLFNIFVNTHSESIVRVTKPEELFLVDKLDGKTKIRNVKKSFPNYDYTKMDVDRMWMSNMFNGGLPW